MALHARLGNDVLFACAADRNLRLSSKPELIFTLMEPIQVAQMEEMYDPDNRVLGRERESDSDAYMFGFYIYNNISIGFQTFAGGLVFGLGSLVLPHPQWPDISVRWRRT